MSEGWQAKVLRAKALAYLEASPVAVTGEEVAQALDANLYSVLPRLTELEQVGRAQSLPWMGKNSRGNSCHLWRAVPEGERPEPEQSDLFA